LFQEQKEKILALKILAKITKKSASKITKTGKEIKNS